VVEIIKQFGEFIKSLDMAAILPLSTGLSAVALILAALLILIALFRRKTSTGNFVLVVFFGLLAGFFVAIDALKPRDATPIIHMMSVGIPKDEEAFPIHVRINNDAEWDLVATPTDRTIKDPQTFIYVNANEVAYRLATRSRQVSELTKKVEDGERLKRDAATITELEGN
jgi:hypothetical protein